MAICYWLFISVPIFVRSRRRLHLTTTYTQHRHVDSTSTNNGNLLDELVNSVVAGSTLSSHYHSEQS